MLGQVEPACALLLRMQRFKARNLRQKRQRWFNMRPVNGEALFPPALANGGFLQMLSRLCCTAIRLLSALRVDDIQAKVPHDAHAANGRKVPHRCRRLEHFAALCLSNRFAACGGAASAIGDLPGGRPHRAVVGRVSIVFTLPPPKSPHSGYRPRCREIVPDRRGHCWPGAAAWPGLSATRRSRHAEAAPEHRWQAAGCRISSDRPA